MTRGERLVARLEARGMEQFAEAINKHEGVTIGGEKVRFVRESAAPVAKAEPTQAEVWQRIETAASANELTVDAYLDTAQGEALFGSYAAMQPVEKAEFPHTAEDGDKAKAAAAAKERKLRPGEGRKMASDVIAEDVKRIRKEHPNWSEAETWSWALEHDQHAIDTYTRGEIAEAQSRTK